MRRLGWFMAGAATATGAALSRELVARRRSGAELGGDEPSSLASPSDVAVATVERPLAPPAPRPADEAVSGSTPDVVSAPHTDAAAAELRERIAATRARVRARREAQSEPLRPGTSVR